MSLFAKRLIFFSLCLLFIGYSFIVATSGTELDKGAKHYSKDAEQGKMLYVKLNCNACHQLYGLGGYMGPDLTNIASAPGKGEPLMKAMLKSGSTRMPDFKLSEIEIDQLVAFLKYVDKTGVSPVINHKSNSIGTVEVVE